ncbi:hypothetical protein BASA81_013756 [Batrachochytrium salamandrivorans]|nr:hypothetical protein BASA81_013756 [Batrachochytrium salamandrivorans]
MPKTVHFSERVTVASLPVEEFKDSLNARRGPWGSAPVSDELWDGERRLFWERELLPEELREILRFRKLAKYSIVLQNSLGGGSFLKVPMPKIPTIVEELVHLGQLEKARAVETAKLVAAGDSPRLEAFKQAIAFPEDQEEEEQPLPPTPTAIDAVLFSHHKDDETGEFAYSNPILQPDANAHATRQHGSGVLSPSQRESIRSATKVIKQVVLHRGRTKQKRLRRRAKTHAILQPWYVGLYFLLPMLLVGSAYLFPLASAVFSAWRNQHTIRAVVEVPELVLKLLPQNPVLQSTVSVGLFVFEMTGLVYLVGLVLTQLLAFAVVRPLVLSLSNSINRGGEM